jgi:hypothetical protein
VQLAIPLLTFGTLGLIAFKYYTSREVKKLFISLGLFGVLIALALAGNITRQIIPLFLVHILLVIFGWIVLLWYIFKAKLHLWAILSPLVTIILFLIMEELIGSAN